MSDIVHLPGNSSRHSFESSPNDGIWWDARIVPTERVELLKEAAQSIGFFAVHEAAKEGDEMQMGRFTNEIDDTIASGHYEVVGQGETGVYIGRNIEAAFRLAFAVGLDNPMEISSIKTLDTVADKIAEKNQCRAQ